MDVGASFNRALERFKPHAVTLVIGVLALFVINFVATAVPALVINLALDAGIVAGILSALVTGVIGMAIIGPLWGGMYTMVGKAYVGAKPELADLGVALKGNRLKEFVTVGAVMGAPALLGIIPILGTILAPFVNLAVMFLFIPAMIMVAEGSDGKSALAKSKEMVMANATDFAITYIVAGLVSIFVITAPLGLLMILDTYFAKKNAQPAGGIQPTGYDPNQYQQPPQG